MTLESVTLAGAIVLALTLLVTIQVLVMRLLLLAHTRRTERFLGRWEPLLYAAAEGAACDVPPVAATNRRAFLMLWNHLQESVEGDAKDRLNEVARRAGIPGRVERMLERGNLRDRLLAIVTLGHLRDRSVWTVLCAHAASTQIVLSLAAARALIRIDPIAAMQHLMAPIATRTDWAPAQVATLIRTAGPDVASKPLAAAAMAATLTTPHAASRLIRQLDAVQSDVALATARQIVAYAQDKEVITACLRIFKDPKDLDVVKRFVDDPRWEVRVQAVTSIGRMGTEEGVRLLTRALADAEWWVRYRAAEALCLALADAPQQLTRLHHELDDRFARDVLSQVRAEGELR